MSQRIWIIIFLNKEGVLFLSHSTIMQRLLDAKIIAIVRGVAPEHMIPLANALLEGGVSCMEITYNQARAGNETITSLRVLSESFGGDICLGAGTVLTPEQVLSAAEGGARYIISPNTDTVVIKAVKQAGLISMPGAMTPSEVVAAYQAGADIVKLFPAGELGIPYLKALRGPLNHIPLSAVGGITATNARSFLDAGVCCVGVGGSLVNVRQIEAGNFHEITKTARLLVQAVLGNS